MRTDSLKVVRSDLAEDSYAPYSIVNAETNAAIATHLESEDECQRIIQCLGELSAKNQNQLIRAATAGVVSETDMNGKTFSTFAGRSFRPRRSAADSVFRRLWADEAGQDLTEYSLLMVLIALVAIASMQTLGTTVSNIFSNAAGNLTTAS